MRIEKTKNVTPGTILGRTIYRSDGLPLLTRGTSLSERLLERLCQEEILMLYIDDPTTHGIEPSSPIRDITLLKGTQIVKNVFSVLRNATSLKSTSESELTYVYDSQLMDDLNQVLDDIIDDLGTNPDTLYQIIHMSSVDQYTYKHSVDVAVLAMLMGQTLGFDYKTVKHLGMGGLLHDIGKAHIDLEVLNKKSSLSSEEWQEMKKHSLYGYNAIRDVLSIHGFVKQMVLHHHERLDGSGYPYGLTASDINMLTRVIAVSDIFNALGSNRSYREAMNPDKIIDILYTDAVYKLDKNVIGALLKCVHVYPEGTRVQLTDGRTAIVVESRKVAPTRPLIRLDAQDEYLDLMVSLTLFIERVL